MFKYLLLCALVAFVSADDDVHAEIKVLDSDVRKDGFDWTLDTSNGIHAEASGDPHGNIHGEYHYISHDGVPVKISYVADENGYQPHGDLLPTAPPTPEAILKALDYIRAHPSKVESVHGKGH